MAGHHQTKDCLSFTYTANVRFKLRISPKKIKEIKKQLKTILMDKRVSMELTDRRKTAINLVDSRKNGKAVLVK